MDTVLYTFAGGSDGAAPLGGLIADQHGALYGTTYSGGIENNGTIFELTPPTGAQTTWTQTVLYRFTHGADGSHPLSSLIADQKGALYGTTTEGGAYGGGTAFRLTPPAAGQTAWTQTVLHQFGGVGDGFYPLGLVADSQGALYGETQFSATLSSACPNSCGTVFKLAPPAAGHSAWSETVIHSFTGGSDGSGPLGSLVVDRNGVVYGTTPDGGDVACDRGCGVLFKLTPPAQALAPWSEAVLYRFKGGLDGATPSGGLVADPAGALYGATVQGGVVCQVTGYNGCGTVFKLAPPVAGQTAWTGSVLYRFRGGSDGGFPYATLSLDQHGTLFGSTSTGGDSHCFGTGCGTAFRLTPPAPGYSAWTQTVLHSFTGGSDGGGSGGLLVADGGAVLLGVTANGAGNGCRGFGCGTVFRLDVRGPRAGLPAVGTSDPLLMN